MKRLLTLVALATAICASGKSPTTPRIHKTSNEISVTSPASTEPNEAHAPRVMLSAVSYYEGSCTLEGEILSETAGIIDYGFLLSSDMSDDKLRVSVLHKDASSASSFFGIETDNFSFTQLQGGSNFAIRISLPREYTKTITVRAFAVSHEKKQGVSQEKKGIELHGKKSSSLY